ncbi:MAG: sulfatase-like hydrolase/transferase [Acidobacteriota bacterium]
MISIDTLRADHVGSYGYSDAKTPTLDRLAATGARFERATSVMPLTLPAHSSLFTGTFPTFHGVRDNGGFYLSEEATTLAEALGAEGYDTAGFVAAFVLDSRWGIAQGFDSYFDDFDLAAEQAAQGMDAIQRPGREVVDRALEWFEQRDRERPFFTWLHLYDPHTPYAAPPEIQSQFPLTRIGAYDAEIAETDRQIDRLLDALTERGELDDTLVVVVADHGEMLGEHQEITHGYFIYEAATHVPLIFHGPGIDSVVVPDQVRLIDVAPTVLSQLGVGSLPAAQGADLTPALRGDPLELEAYSESWYPRYHYGWSELRALQDGRYKLIQAPTRELYDLDADPAELNNLAEVERDLTNALERRLNQLVEATQGDLAESAPQEIDEETAQRLRALGYLGSAPKNTQSDSDDRERADPKDKIGLYNLLKQATAAAGADETDTAIELVSRALAEDPEIVEAHVILGNLTKRKGDIDAAVSSYRRALELDPEDIEATHLLAVAYKERGDLSEALAGFERVLQLDERNGRALWQIADAQMRGQRFSEAEAVLRRALALDLDPTGFHLKLGECLIEMGRSAEAETEVRKALAETIDLKTANFTLGLALEEQGRIEEAAQAYRQETQHHDDAHRAHFNLGRLLLRMRRPAEATVELQRATELQPQFGTAFLYLAKAHFDSGDAPSAERSARQGLGLDPPPDIAPLGHFILADIYNQRGDSAAAQREAERGRALQRSGR